MDRSRSGATPSWAPKLTCPRSATRMQVLLRLLDTDVCIESLRGNPLVMEQRRATQDRVATTWITACELAYGAANSRAAAANRSLVTEFLATLPILDFNLPAALDFGHHKARSPCRPSSLVRPDPGWHSSRPGGRSYGVGA
ncbi:type II toxin-antitoxin system VapC family toxin, partial [uncultured Thiodictyon sp.]|uniref:type II toxin-antitoxin system VapC family toxin n=3 Tax=uncultured Thiodictyon sp. TaxID=1846217 RepID=UPI00345C7629